MDWPYTEKSEIFHIRLSKHRKDIKYSTVDTASTGKTLKIQKGYLDVNTLNIFLKTMANPLKLKI